MSVVEAGDGIATGPFVSREVYGDEIRETFVERPDKLSGRETFSNSSNWYDHFSRGRRDWLKTASYSEDASAKIYEGEFYRRPGAPERYKHEASVKQGAESLKMSCLYDREPDEEDQSTCKTVTLQRTNEFNAETMSLARLRSMVASVREEFTASKTQAVVRYDHDFLSGDLTITLWPKGMYEKAHTGDPDVDMHLVATYVYNSAGEIMRIENDNTEPSAEDLSAQYEWVRFREESLIAECLEMERWLMFFRAGRSSEKGNACIKDAEEHAAVLESTIRQLLAKLDLCEARAVAGDKKAQAYDGLSDLLESKISKLEQNIRDKDRLIRELTTNEAPDPAWLQAS